MAEDDAKIAPFPKGRLWLVDVLAEARRKPLELAFVTADVERVRAQIREHRERTGEQLSFTAFVIWCVARTVARCPELNTYRLGRRRQITFEHVDVFTPLVVRLPGEGERLTPHVIRAAEQRSFRAIHEEIRAVQRGEARQADASPERKLLRWVLAHPNVLTRTALRLARRDPRIRRKLSGTVIVTAPGLMSRASGHGTAHGSATLTVALGTVQRLPRVVGDRIEPRDMLHLTVAFDHEIVDGAPIARFLDRLFALIEAGLPDDLSEIRSSAEAERRHG